MWLPHRALFNKDQTMNALELQKRDWVLLFGKYPATVFAIDETEFYVTDKDGEDWHVAHAHVQPIAITTEILQANGFTFHGGGKSRKPWQVVRPGVYISWSKDRLVLRYRRELGRPATYMNVDCHFVHELQHALRMAGIEEEVVL